MNNLAGKQHSLAVKSFLGEILKATHMAVMISRLHSLLVFFLWDL
jgi:hypothetical protein